VLVIVLVTGIGILLLQILAQQLCIRSDARKFPAPGKLIGTAEDLLHMQQRGAGAPPVVFESGIAASSLNWSILQSQLAEFTSTYGYDRPGFGWSARGSRTCTLRRMSDDLHRFVTAAEVPRPYVLVGHSYAAYILRVYAQRHPQEIAGIVLIDPLTPEEWINPDRFQRRRLWRGAWFSRAGGVLGALGVVRFCLWLLQRGNNAVPRKVVSAFGGQAKETVARILGELTKLPPSTVRLIRERWSQARFFWTMAGYIQTLPECAAEVCGCNIPAHIPVTVISGAHQPAMRMDEHKALAAHSHLGRHLVAANSAHWVHLDQPELIVAAFQEMAAKLADAGVHTSQ